MFSPVHALGYIPKLLFLPILTFKHLALLQSTHNGFVYHTPHAVLDTAYQQQTEYILLAQRIQTINICHH